MKRKRRNNDGFVQLELGLVVPTAPPKENPARDEALRLLAANLSATDWMVVHVGEGGECATCGYAIGTPLCECKDPVALETATFGQIMENIGKAVQRLAEEGFFPEGTVIAARLRVQRTCEPVTFYVVEPNQSKGPAWRLEPRSSEEAKNVDWARVAKLVAHRAAYAARKNEYQTFWDAIGRKEKA